MDKQVIREKVQLMLDRPFYGSLIVRLQLREWDSGTFGVDGEYIYVPKKHNFTPSEIRAILAHETMHCALQHIFRMGNRDRMKWNVAADYAVNLILEKDGFTMPKGALLDNKFSGMHAEKIYAKLPDPIKIKIPIDLLQPGQNKKGNGKNGELEISVQPLDEQGKKEAQAKADELAQEWKEYLSHAIEKGRGDVPGDLKEFIEELLFPKISWEEILYKYLHASKGCQDFTAYPFDRRHIYRDIYLPSMRGDSIEICVGIDTSGSISHDDLIDYFSEVRGICSIFGDYTIYLFQGDSKLQKEDIITSDSDIPNFVIGRGGTNFCPVFKHIEELELTELPLVYFTDLDGEFPKEARPNVFWIIQKGNKITKVPFGEIIEIVGNNDKHK